MTTHTFTQVCLKANRLRIEMGHNYLSTEHFLLACFEVECVGGRILANLGVTQEAILQELHDDPTGRPDFEREAD